MHVISYKEICFKINVVSRSSDKKNLFFSLKEMQTYFLQCRTMAEELDAVVISIE